MIKSDQIYLLLGAIAIAFAPIFVKLASISAGSIGFYRMSFGFLAIYLYACIVQKKLLYVKGKRLGLLLLGGLIFCLDLYFWHLSIKIIGAGLSTVLANTQIFFAALISHFLFKERIPKIFIVWGLLAIVGLYYLCAPDTEITNQKDFSMGVALAIAAGSLYASFMSCIKIWRQKFPGDPAYSPVLWISLGTAFAFALIDGFQFDDLTRIDFLWMLLLGVVVHAGGWLFINRAIQTMKFSNVSLGLLLQPVLASIIAFYLFDERLSEMQILGMIICLFAIYRGQLSLHRS